jgi:hypothetical protein
MRTVMTMVMANEDEQKAEHASAPLFGLSYQTQLVHIYSYGFIAVTICFITAVCFAAAVYFVVADLADAHELVVFADPFVR